MNNIPNSFLLKNRKFARLINCIQSIEDPRRREGLHPFESIMVIGLCAMLAGSNNFTAMSNFGKNHYDWFIKFLYLPHGIPSHDTFNKIFGSILPNELKKLMHFLIKSFSEDKSFTKKHNPVLDILEDHLAIDGKMLRAFRLGNKLIIEHAWSTKLGMIINQLRILAEEGEITAIPKLLDRLDIKNKVITIDAIGTQKKIIKMIVKAGGFYVSALKGNQHNFYQDVKDFMDSLSKGEFNDVKRFYHETVDKDHGRIEKRKIWTTTSINWLKQKKEWKDLKTIMVVESIVEETGKATTTERRYFISNLQLNAEIFLSIIRNHWAIESKCHWLLNTTFDEKRLNLKKSYAPENMSVLRKVCLALITHDALKLSVREKRAKGACDFNYLLKLLIDEDIDTRSNFQKASDFAKKISEYIQNAFYDFIEFIFYSTA